MRRHISATLAACTVVMVTTAPASYAQAIGFERRAAATASAAPGGPMNNQAPATVGAASNDAHAKRRYQIKVMEGVLVGSVKHGAEQLARRLQPLNPNLLLLTGMARARGFVLDGYGVFFDVEIPAMRESVAWTMRTLEPDFTTTRRILDQMKRQLDQLSDPKARMTLQQALRGLEAQIVPMRRDNLARTVVGASVDESEQVPQSEPVPQLPASAPSKPSVDPNVLYTESVKNALIEAMLEYGGPLGIQPDEWLTVAARDGEGPLTPLENYEAVTLILRIKGIELAAVRAGRITPEEARKRVEVKEF
jgi:hypothetical protein